MENHSLRLDIQGLRALAALSVVIFHISPTELTGGYLGVDIFFVISGYLIMGQIWRSLENGRFSFSDFYVRRLKRLLPALSLVIVVSSIPAYFLLLPSEFQNYTYSVFSSLFYVSNFWFYTKSGYFDAELQTAPLLHTWSLSVEEQFYLVFPLLLALLHLTCSKKKVVFLLLGSVALCSLVMSELLVNHNQSLSFYASPTRFWQFIVGGLVAMLNLTPPNVRVARASSLIGLTILVVVLSFFNEDTSFPGVAAIPVTFATALVIYANSKRGFSGWILSNPVSNYFGNISYALYLWHWPAITFYKIYLFEKSVNYGTYLETEKFVEFHIYDKLVVFVVSLVLASLTYHCVESPLKRWKLPGGTYKPVAASLLATLGIVLAVSSSGYLQSARFTDQARSYDAYLSYSNPHSSQGCFLTSKLNDFSLFDQAECINAERGKFNILLLGDSHAEHWASAIKASLQEDQTLSYATASGCRPILPLRGPKRCTELMDWAFNKLTADARFSKIILAGRWLQEDIEHIANTISLLKNSTKTVLVMGPVIEYDYSLAMLLAKFGDSPSLMQFTNYDEHRRFSLDVEKATLQGGGEYFSTVEAMCGNGAICQFTTERGVPTQYDYGHLTHEGALNLVTGSVSIFRQGNIDAASEQTIRGG